MDAQTSSEVGKTALDVLPSLVAVAITFIVLDTFFVSLHFISRTCIQRMSWAWDDYLIIPAYITNIGLCAIGIEMAQAEMSLNSPASAVITDPHILEIGAKSIYAILPLLYFGAVFPKLSMLCLYLRVFEGHRGVRRWTIATMILVLAAGIAFTLTGLFSCTPVRYFWDRNIPGGHCIQIDVYFRTNTPVNLVFDLMILIIPMPALWRLQAPRRKKIGLTFVFAMGGVGAIACLVRFIVLLKYTSELLIPVNTAIIVGWCIIEPAIYLIAACLPPCASIPTLLFNNRAAHRKLGVEHGQFTGLHELSPRSGEPAHSESLQHITASDKTGSRVREGRSEGSADWDRDEGIGVRTDIYIEQSRGRDPHRELTLGEMLARGS